MMERWFFSSLLVALSLSSGAQVSSDNAPLHTNGVSTNDSVKEAKIQFEYESFDIRTISNDTVVQRTYAFKNVGNDTLIILSTTADCSCTVPDFGAGVFAPGETGEIKVSFDGSDNIGRLYNT
jgi:hypothetical protein